MDNTYPKWVKRGPDIGAVLCLNEDEERALLADHVTEQKAEVTPTLTRETTSQVTLSDPEEAEEEAEEEDDVPTPAPVYRAKDIPVSKPPAKPAPTKGRR